MKVYIAAPFFNEQQLLIVQKVENILLSYDIDCFSPRSEGILKDMTKQQQKNNRKHIYDSNIKHMNDCTHMLACVEYKDTGTIFEIGYYAAKEKPIVLFSENLNTVNVMLAQSASSICDNFDKLVFSLDGSYSVEIENLT